MAFTPHIVFDIEVRLFIKQTHKRGAYAVCPTISICSLARPVCTNYLCIKYATWHGVLWKLGVSGGEGPVRCFHTGCDTRCVPGPGDVRSWRRHALPIDAVVSPCSRTGRVCIVTLQTHCVCPDTLKCMQHDWNVCQLVRQQVRHTAKSHPVCIETQGASGCVASTSQLYKRCAQWRAQGRVTFTMRHALRP